MRSEDRGAGATERPDNTRGAGVDLVGEEGRDGDSATEEKRTSVLPNQSEASLTLKFGRLALKNTASPPFMALSCKAKSKMKRIKFQFQWTTLFGIGTVLGAIL